MYIKNRQSGGWAGVGGLSCFLVLPAWENSEQEAADKKKIHYSGGPAASLQYIVSLVQWVNLLGLVFHAPGVHKNLQWN